MIRHALPRQLILRKRGERTWDAFRAIRVKGERLTSWEMRETSVRPCREPWTYRSACIYIATTEKSSQGPANKNERTAFEHVACVRACAYTCGRACLRVLSDHVRHATLNWFHDRKKKKKKRKRKKWKDRINSQPCWVCILPLSLFASRYCFIHLSTYNRPFDVDEK